MSEQASREWYTASMGNHQGLIVDMTTGNNIAVAYDKANAPLIAAAPELLETLEAIVNILEQLECGIVTDRLERKAREAIAQATGE